MDMSRLRGWQKRQFIDPKSVLVPLGQLQPFLASSNLPLAVKTLRTNALKRARESREAALFCYGLGVRIGQTVYYSDVEDQDYDFIASWVVRDKQHFAPVQLKEIVPVDLNATASIDSTIQSLKKYVDSNDLTVALYLNQAGQFSLRDVSIPPLNIAALWMFGCISTDLTQWGLWGNFLEGPEESHFVYPTS